MLVFAAVFNSSSMFSQSFVLTDDSSGDPVPGVYFTYGDESGISGSDGLVEITLSDGETLLLSHLRYGQIHLNNEQVLSALNAGKWELRSRPYELLPVTVVSIHSPIYSQTSHEMNVVDKLNHDGGDILDRSVGFSSIRKSGAFGLDPVFRGFKNDQLNIVIDGVQSCLAACPNRMDPPTSQISPNMMERMEILKGPHALRYGSSFGATINFTTPAPDFSESFRIGGRAAAGYDSNGDVFRTESRIGLSSENFDISLFGALSRGNDYKDGDGVAVAGNFERVSLGAIVHYRLDDRQYLSLSATRNAARDVDFPALGMDLRRDDTWLVNTTHRMNFIEGYLRSLNTSVFVSYVDHLMDNLEKPLEPRMVNASTPAETVVLGGRSEAEWRFKEGSLWTGVDIRREAASGSREREFLMGPNEGKVFTDPAWQDANITKYALFGEYQRSFGELRFILSTRLELNDAGMDEQNEEFSQFYEETDQRHFNPSFSTGVRKYWTSQFSTGIWLGRAQRSGSLTERYIHFLPVGNDPFELFGNPNLKPEKINQLDLNLNYGRPGHDLQLDLFAAYMQDVISARVRDDIDPQLPMAPGVRQFINVDRAFKIGFELQWEHQLSNHLSQIFGLSYTRARDLDLNEPLAEIPPLDLQYRLQGRLLDNKLRPAVSVRHTFKQDRISKEFGELETPSFTVLDFNLNYQLSPAFFIGLGVSNLLDESYYEHLSRPIRAADNRPVYAPGRSYNIYTSVRF